MKAATLILEDVSKKFDLHRIEKTFSLREWFSRWFSLPSSNSQQGGVTEEPFWAVQDVSFQAFSGESWGIIGRNGAGKSTLLKLISRIMYPTHGRIILRGRVASLLEVGTGFHPELSGRENIFLNGVILGMTQREIRQNLDEIIAFAEIEKFVDVPVKRYSSGMYVRLAFAVAAHLETDILLVDEVLAVGDSAFQKKCLGRMDQARIQEGKTVLFVSHNMAAIQQMCSKCILLERGRILQAGETGAVVRSYLDTIASNKGTPLMERKDRQGNGRLRFSSVELLDEHGKTLLQVLSGMSFRIRFHYVSEKPAKEATINIGFNIFNDGGLLLTNINTLEPGNDRLPVHEHGFFECRLERFCFRSGKYDCSLFCEIDGEISDWLLSAFSLLVEDGDFFRTGRLRGRGEGDLLVPSTWQSVKV